MTRNQEKLLTTSRIRNLYYLDQPTMDTANAAASPHSATMQIWHQRMGHPSLEGLKKLPDHSTGCILDMDEEKQLTKDFCIGCSKGKIHRKHHGRSFTSQAKEMLEVIHTDLCGFIKPASRGGRAYFILFSHESTRKCWIYLLKEKREAADAFGRLKEMVELQTGKQIKRVRSDGGGEFVGERFASMLNGIIHEISTRDTPQQNGHTKRMNRTVLESMKAMLYSGDFCPTLWAEAASTAVLLYNHLAYKALG